MRQHGRWLVVAIVTVAVGCAGDASPGFDAGGVGDATHFALTVGTPTVATLTPGHGAVVELRGATAQPLVRLNVGPRAITRAVELSIRETAAPWGHVGPAYEIEPSGLEFAEPVTIEFDLATIGLPPGTRPESLRVATVENGRWVPIGPPAGDAGDVTTLAAESPRIVSAQLRHLSPYGIVADPREVSGVGRRLEANGIVAETTDEVYARLFVSPTIVTLYVDGGAAGTTQLTLSGLPTDEDHVLYVDDHDGMRTITPADGGTVTVDLDRAEPHQLWLQEHASTVVIGGPSDACATVGIWTDPTTCTLSADVADNVVIAQSGVTLDCDGHSIIPPLKPPPAVGEVLAAQGAGILISKIHDVVVRECHVGRAGAGFGIGIWVYFTDGADIADNVLSENVQGIVSQVSTGVVVHDNQVQDSWVSGIAIQDLASVTAENLPPPLPQVEVWGNTISQTADSKSTAIDVRGTPAKFINDAVGVATNGLPPITVHDNVVTGGGNAITLASVLDVDVQENDFDSPERGLLILDGGWPSRFWHNNVTASMFGVVDARQPASGGTLPPANYTYKEPPPDGAPPDVPLVEVSWSDQGSWWGHSCGGGGLFTPGVDSNAVHVRDSHAYGARDAWASGGVPGCAGDVDGDTVPDGVDNCPTVPNPGQEDGEGDGVGDACDVTPPPSPAIDAPEAGAILTTSTILVRGTAEPGVTVKVLLDGMRIVSTAAQADGRFTSALLAVADGLHQLRAAAVDAAGNFSAPSGALFFTVHTVAPPPPSILSPRPLSSLNDALLDVEGYSERAASIRLLVDGVLDQLVPVDRTSRWLAESVGPVGAGVHSLTAEAVDAWGLVSAPSQEIRIVVQPVGDSTPVLGARGKLRVVALKDDPDPFIGGVEGVTFALRAVLDSVRGLNGRSERNHNFVIRAHWTVLDPRTGIELRRIDAEKTVVVPQGPGTANIVVELAAAWDGRDSTDDLVPQGRQLAIDVRAEVVRNYVGRGVGPRCGRDEDDLSDAPGRPACLVDALLMPAESTTMAIAAPSLPTASIRIPRGWTLREATGVRFPTDDRYGVVGVLRGSPATGGPEAHRVVFWVIEGDSSAAASYGHVISDPSGIEVWRNVGTATEPTRHGIGGLRVSTSPTADSCAVLAWRYDLSPDPEVDCSDTPLGRTCIAEAVGAASLCPDGTVGWLERDANVTHGTRFDDPRYTPVWLFGPAVAARDGEFLIDASSGSQSFWHIRSSADGAVIGGATNCWPPDTPCWVADDPDPPDGGPHSTPELSELLWHPASGHYLLALVLRDGGNSIGCVVGTRIATDGTELGFGCLEGESRRFHSRIPVTDLPTELFLSSADNTRNPLRNILFATDRRVLWLDAAGAIVPSVDNPQLDEGIRALCEDWTAGAGTTVARAFRWTAEVLNPYDPWCTEPSMWVRCLALSDATREPLATQELIYGAAPAPAVHGRRFNWFLADACVASGTSSDGEVMVLDPGYRGVVVYMLGY
jgi:hypothetical protein